jgi:hypothetical protein
MKPNTTEMKVDNVGSMTKSGAKCVLKGEKEINGYIAKFSLVVTCEEFGVFNELNISEEDCMIDMVLKDPEQKKLDSFGEEEVEIVEAVE